MVEILDSLMYYKGQEAIFFEIKLTKGFQVLSPILLLWPK